MMNQADLIRQVTKATGMPPQFAAQVIQQLPVQLAKSGIDINKLPAQQLLEVIKQTYGRVKSGKTAPVPPKPPGLGGTPMNANPAQQNALAAAAQNNNK